MSGNPTIYEVARRASVSISTVSLTMNDPGRVSGEARERVLRAIDELGYVPKSDAVSRARQGVGRIGVIALFSTYPSSSARLNGVFEELARQKNAPEIVVINQEPESVDVSPLLDSLPITGHLDGLLIMGITPSKEAVARFRRQHLPVVVVGIADHDLEIPTISIAEASGARLAAAHLLSREPERYLYLGERQDSDENSSQSQLRGDAFQTRLLELGIDPERIDIRNTTYDLEDAARTVGEYLEEEHQTIGIFAYCDLLAAGALRAARQAGRGVPSDVSIVGFDDDPTAAALSLTSIRQPLRESGQAAVRLLLQRMREESQAHANIELGTSLIVRDS